MYQFLGIRLATKVHKGEYYILGERRASLSYLTAETLPRCHVLLLAALRYIGHFLRTFEGGPMRLLEFLVEGEFDFTQGILRGILHGALRVILWVVLCLVVTLLVLGASLLVWHLAQLSLI